MLGALERPSWWLGLALLTACERVETRTFVITSHTLADASCAVLPAGAKLEIHAVGDHAALAPALAQPGSELLVRPGTRGFEVQTLSAGPPFAGYAARGPERRLPVLLWPLGRDCRLDGSGVYPALGGGQGLGYSERSRTLFLAGGEDPEERPATSLGALAFDAGTGSLTRSALPDSRGPRAFPTVTALGDGLLIAGGEDPLNSENDVVVPSRTAEVYIAGAAEFRREGVELRVPRTRHSAIALPSGDTLLVGGRGPFGDALNVLERVSPGTSQSTLAGLAALHVPRLFPTVLLLDDGRLLIAGGAAADETPLSAMEWLSADAQRSLDLQVFDELPSRYDRAFAALPGGSVLVVGGCEPRAAESGEDCSACRRGCPPREDAGNVVYDAWWISPDNELTSIPLPMAAPRPVLLGGADGQPLLFPGSDSAGAYRFDPWGARFEPLATASERSSSGTAASGGLDCPPRAGLPHVALDAQTFAWVAECGQGAELRAARFGTANALSEGFTLVPDRAPQQSFVRLLSEGGFSFEANAPARIRVAGREFADFELHLTYEGAPPLLVLSSPARVGALTVDLRAAAKGRELLVRRAGRSLQVGDQVHDTPPGRVALGFAAPSGRSGVTSLRVDRLP